tara:strand:- start:7225 stop:7722 length:498 start_codon:yes stop_codon:yes gene_type:complete
MSTQRNGRIDIVDANKRNQFELFDRIHIDDKSSFRDAMIGNWTDSLLSKAFFSGENIQIIQNGIRAGVYERSNNRFVIGLQDIDIIKVVMRSIFLQHSANMQTHITQQISALNKLVLDYLVPNAYSGIISYVNYKRDVSSLAVPMDLPIKASTDNKKTLELKNFF